MDQTQREQQYVAGPDMANLQVDLRKFTELVERQQALFAAETERLLVEAADGTLSARCPERPDTCNGSLLIEGVGTIKCPANPCPHQASRDRFADACILKACGFQAAEQHPDMTLVPTEFHEPLKRYCATIKDRRKAGHGLLFRGPIGCGKTTAMGFVALAAVKAGYTFQMADSSVLVAKLNYLQRSGRHTDFDGEQRQARDIEEQCMTVDFLFVDDFGAENADELARCWDKYSAIINHRYRTLMPTLLTTNLDGAALTKRPDFSRLISRIASRNPVITTQAEGQRGKTSIEDWV